MESKLYPLSLPTLKIDGTASLHSSLKMGQEKGAGEYSHRLEKQQHFARQEIHPNKKNRARHGPLQSRGFHVMIAAETQR